MSGVFDHDKSIRVDPNLPFGTNTSAKMYMYFYCPKCSAKHKYGHNREYIDCWRCWYSFSPNIDSYRKEEDRISSLSPELQAEARKNQAPPPWAKKKRKKKAAPPPPPPKPWYQKFFDLFRK